MSTAESLRSGILERDPRGHGYLRDPARNYRAAPGDPQVEARLLDRFHVRQGARVTGRVELAGNGATSRLVELTEVEGRTPEQHAARPAFDDLTAVDPHEAIRLETVPERLGPRIMDLLTPVGKGQRGLIVAPPRTGKTILLQQIADAVTTNHPEVTPIVLLVDERPEEVTEMKRGVRAEVIASSNDRPHDEHIRLAELAVDRARRIAEAGGDALVLIDSLTRLARAYNKNSSSGRTMSGGVDIRALEVPKRLFGAARAFDEGGSLTILATCLIETNSRMDDLIFEEFKGTGNMELILDRRLANRRVWPAFDILRSGTRKEERLLAPETLARVTLLRRTLAGMKPAEATEGLVRQMEKYPSNQALLDRIGQVREQSGA